MCVKLTEENMLGYTSRASSFVYYISSTSGYKYRFLHLGLCSCTLMLIKYQNYQDKSSEFMSFVKQCMLGTTQEIAMNVDNILYPEYFLQKMN